MSSPHPYGSPQLGPFAPPPPPPPPRRGRPWILPAAIGGVVVLVVAISLVVIGVLVTLPKQATGTLTGLPNPPISGACRVGSVCATLNGVSLVLTSVDRNYQPPPQAPMSLPLPAGLPKGTPTLPPIPAFTSTPLPGFHVVRVEVMFQVAGRGQHEVFPDEVILIDSQGQPQFLNEFLDLATCTTSQGGAFGPGTKVGPTPLCFEVAGPVDGTLTLNWSTADIALPGG